MGHSLISSYTGSIFSILVQTGYKDNRLKHNGKFNHKAMYKICLYIYNQLAEYLIYTCKKYLLVWHTHKSKCIWAVLVDW